MYKLVRAMGLVVSLARTGLLLATFAAPVTGLRGTPMTTTANPGRAAGTPAGDRRCGGGGE